MRAGVVPGADAGVIETMAGLHPSQLPAPSDVALRVMQACADPASNARSIARLVSATPSLAAQLLRITNSAYFGFPGKITSISRAVSLLGQRSVRYYVLCLAMRDALTADAVHGGDVGAFWRASFTRAVAARLLGESTGADPDECFTAGLLIDVGVAALFHARPERIGYWDAFMRENPEDRLEREREIFGVTHDRVGAMLADAWGLPDRLVAAIGEHHRDLTGESVGAGRPPGLAKVALVADWAAAVCRSEARRRDIERAFQVAAAELGLERPHMASLLDRLPEEVARATEAFGLALPAAPAARTLLHDANLALIEEHASVQELNWRLQRALDERDAFGERLRAELETAREVQRSLFPPRADAMGRFAGVSAPARELSGDFFDHFTLADGRSFFCLADVAGKGMNAALLMAKASGLLRCLAKLVPDPAKLLGLVNAELVETSVRGMFVTMVAGIYDPGRRTVDLINAGHPPGLMVNPAGDVRVLETQFPPLGIAPGQRYAAHRHPVRGRKLYLFSDGLLEASDPGGAHLGYPGLIEVVRGMLGTSGPELPARILTRIGRTHDFTGDDVTLLVLEG